MKMTNEEELKSLSTEELAEFIADIADCANCNNPINCDGNCKSAWKQWLKSEVTNEQI